MSDDLEYVVKYKQIPVGMQGDDIGLLSLTEAELSLPDGRGAMVGYGKDETEATLDALRNATIIGGLINAIQLVDQQQQLALTELLFGGASGSAEGTESH